MIVLLCTFIFQILATQCEKIVDPTLKPVDPFSVVEDAVELRAILKIDLGWQTSKDRLHVSKLWFHRTYDQRAQIEAYYNANFCNGNSHLTRCSLKSGFDNLSNDSHNDLYTDSLIPPENLLGKIAHEAIDGKWKEVGAIEEIVCANDKEMKDRINQFYNANYHDTVENHLATFRSDDKDYQDVMKKYCWAGLCQDKKIKPEDADREAQALRAINPALREILLVKITIKKSKVAPLSFF